MSLQIANVNFKLNPIEKMQTVKKNCDNFISASLKKLLHKLLSF